MTDKEREAYTAKIEKMGDSQLLEEIAHNVFEACIKSNVGQASEEEDTKCSILFALCDGRGKADFYQKGWERGTEGLR